MKNVLLYSQIILSAIVNVKHEEDRVVEMRWGPCGLLLLVIAERSDEACPDTQETIRGNPGSFTQSRTLGICDLNP